MRFHWTPLLLVLISIDAEASNLMITGVFDGPRDGGLPKGIELYVARDVADLSEYSVGAANNGEGSDGPEFVLPEESVDAGEFLYIASEEFEFDSFFGFLPTYTSGAMRINGDDAIELFHLDSLIDVFGEATIDGSGQPWEYTDGWAYRQQDQPAEDARFLLDSWTFSGPDAWDGSFTNDDSESPMPIGSFTPPLAETTPLQAGDADRDLDFDQFDLIQVQVAAKYLTGQSATWGEGDWDGAPGGEPSNPPRGDGFFNQLDIISALEADIYLSGTYAVHPPGVVNTAEYQAFLPDERIAVADSFARESSPLVLAVPEPATYRSLLIALAALTYVRRWRVRF